MPISGLVITLKENNIPDSLLKNDALDLGQMHNGCLPAVLDTSSSDEDKKHWEFIHSLPNVQKVDVVFVSVEGDPS